MSIVAGATVPLNGEGDPNSVLLFQSFTTMLMIHGAKAKNVSWGLGTILAAGAGTIFEGSILAGTDEGSILTGSSITFKVYTVVEGSVMAGSALHSVRPLKCTVVPSP
jgi:hypothetical protein